MMERSDWICRLRALALLSLAVGAMSAQAAEVTARLDRTEIVEGETVTLVIQTDDPGQSLEADFSVLEPDFDLLDRRSETQMSITNGRQTAVVRLLLTLEPRRTGDLKVPRLQFPGAQTEALFLHVEPAPEPAPGEMPPVFIEMSLEPSDGPFYVHGQLSLTVKIFYQQNLTEASINPPAPEQASVRLLDEVPYPAERNGTRYRVLQRSYAVFPERSGTLVIPPLRLTGRLIERSGTRLWQPSVRGRRITEESEPLSVEILPRPEGFTGDHWLPARELTLSQQLSESNGLKVGEPVTRTVIVDAVGLEENMLVEPAWPDMPDARIYPDQPQGISRDDGQWVRGHKEFRYAVVPEKAGELVLPELQIDWWDTVNDQPRSAILPEMKVQVAASQLVPQQERPETAGETLVDRAAPGITMPSVAESPLWKFISLGLAVAWLGTLVLYFRARSGRALRPSDAVGVPSVEADLLTALKRACQQADMARSRLLLRKWLRQFGPAAAHGSIVEFSRLVEGTELQGELERFERHGYRADADSDWNGSALWKAFEAWHRDWRRDSNGPDRQTPDLYAPAR